MTSLPDMIDEQVLKVKSARHQLNICVTHHLPLSGSCCQCPLQTAGLGSPRAPPARAPGPAPDWPCCCPCYEVSGEAISSTGDRTASRPLLCPHLLSAPARVSRRPLGKERERKKKSAQTWNSMLNLQSVTAKDDNIFTFKTLML